jgi:nucleolar protein 58
LVAVDSGTDFFACSFKLKNFKKFDSAATAVEEAASIIEGKVTPLLTEVLKDLKDEKKASLAVADVKLGMYHYLKPISSDSLTSITNRKCHQ